MKRYESPEKAEHVLQQTRSLEQTPVGGPIQPQNSWPVYEDSWMGNWVIGDWEYRVLRFKTKRKYLRVEWSAEIGIVDKYGLEDQYNDMFNPLVGSWFGPKLYGFGQFIAGDSHTFLRGTFLLNGEVDCCRIPK